jgi:hypothetical protein
MEYAFFKFKCSKMNDANSQTDKMNLETEVISLSRKSVGTIFFMKLKTKSQLMAYLTDYYSNSFVSEFPDDQPPATSYPDPQKKEQQAPMNPTPYVPGTDAPEVVPGSNVEEAAPEESEIPVEDADN